MEILGANLGINTGNAGVNNVLNGMLDSVGTNLMGGHSSIEGVASNLFSTALSQIPFGSLLGSIGLTGAFQKSMSVLANGFDITCFGSSKPPTKIKEILNTKYKPYFDQILSALQGGDVTIVNEFLKSVYLAHFASVAMQTAAKWSKCSRKGVKLYLDYMQPLKNKADELLKLMSDAGGSYSLVSMPQNMKLNGFLLEGGENKMVQVPVFKAQTQPVRTLQTEPTTIPKVSLPLSDIGNDPNPVLEQIKNGGEYMMQGGTLKEVEITRKTPVASATAEKKSSSFPWWLALPLLGAMG